MFVSMIPTSTRRLLAKPSAVAAAIPVVPARGSTLTNRTRAGTHSKLKRERIDQTGSEEPCSCETKLSASDVALASLMSSRLLSFELGDDTEHSDPEYAFDRARVAQAWVEDLAHHGDPQADESAGC